MRSATALSCMRSATMGRSSTSIGISITGTGLFGLVDSIAISITGTGEVTTAWRTFATSVGGGAWAFFGSGVPLGPVATRNGVDCARASVAHRQPTSAAAMATLRSMTTLLLTDRLLQQSLGRAITGLRRKAYRVVQPKLVIRWSGRVIRWSRR